MLGDQTLELGYDADMVSLRELAFQPILERSQSHLLEPGRVRAGKRLVDEIAEGRTAPQAERLAEAAGRGSRICGQRHARIANQPLEPDQVELVTAQSQEIARGSRDEKLIGVGAGAVWLQRPAQRAQVDLKGVGGARRRSLPPQRVDQLVR